MRYDYEWAKNILENYNKCKRKIEGYEMPTEEHVGWAIDAAIDALRKMPKYD